MNSTPSFTDIRMRRLRYNTGVRNLTRHTPLHPGSLIYPLFVRVGENIRHEIGSMPGQFQLSIDQLVVVAREAHDLGLGGIILFGIPDQKIARAVMRCILKELYSKPWPKLKMLFLICWF